MLQEATTMGEPTFSGTGLAAEADMITPALPAAIRAATDADRYYERECDRDLATAHLDSELPAGCHFSLAEQRTVARFRSGEWATATRYQAVYLPAGDGEALATRPMDTPGEAATELVRLYREQQATRMGLPPAAMIDAVAA